MTNPEQKPQLTTATPEEIDEVGARKHAINVLITELEFARLKSVAYIERADSTGRRLTVSGVVRMALDSYFENHPQQDFIESEARISLAFQVEREKRDLGRTHD